MTRAVRRRRLLLGNAAKRFAPVGRRCHRLFPAYLRRYHARAARLRGGLQWRCLRLDAPPEGRSTDRGPGPILAVEPGELAYVHLQGMHLLERNPACHYAFRTAAGFSHDEAERTFARALNLGPGQ